MISLVVSLNAINGTFCALATLGNATQIRLFGSFNDTFSKVGKVCKAATNFNFFFSFKMVAFLTSSLLYCAIMSGLISTLNLMMMAKCFY
jgi:hypothetical protein